MVHFPFGPSEERLELEKDLTFIQNHITNAHQFALLNKRALKLFNTRWISVGGSRDDILVVIKQVHAKVVSVPVGSGHDLSMDQHQQFREILREGFEKLNSLTKRKRDRIETDTTRELDAIELDQVKIDKAIRIQASLPPMTTTQIRIYSMDNPTDDPPITLSDDFTCYKDVAWYLLSYYPKFVPRPELWVRLRAQHGMGKNGYKWKFAEGPNPIESSELDVVNMENRRSGNYIVALAHDNISGEEIPIPMDVANWYDFNNEAKRCCNPFCGTLRRHLQTHFPDRCVVAAKSLKQPSKCVIDIAFDTSQFPPRTNNLYLQWKSNPPV